MGGIEGSLGGNRAAADERTLPEQPGKSGADVATQLRYSVGLLKESANPEFNEATA